MNKIFFVLCFFISTIITYSQKGTEDPFSWYAEVYSDSELAISDLTLLKTKIDFNNDGIIDIATSDESLRGNAGTQWALYLGLENGLYKYLDDIFFHPLAFKITPVEPKVSKLIMYMRDDAAKGNLIEYQISASGIKIINTTPLNTTDNVNDKKLYDELFSYLGNNPIVVCCKLSNYKKDKNCEWKFGYYLK